ncbi:hypothetical protein [Pediococcus acidilactici]|uniref:hypothetical protein n=1 Tax=Pediococcus acidilactici TaxID=1254 RepID=UPI00325B199C
MKKVLLLKKTKYGWCSSTEIKIFGELDRQIKQKKKDDPKKDRPFIVPKKERETIKIDWRCGGMT